jgi:two-component system copper resistance phosphate regulon response regulator CusR
MRILLVEDSTVLRASLCAQLREQQWSVDDAADGRTALAYLERYPYDIVVLDLMLPGIDGLEVLRRLRASGSAVRVLVLSARDQVADRVDALNHGADDYLVKPFAFQELASRLLALMRRQVDHGQPLLEYQGLAIDPRARVAKYRDRVLGLTPKEYALLETLLRNRGQVLAREQVFEQLYDSRSESSDKVIEVLVSTLRAKLAAAGKPDLITTRRGFGYLVE